MRVIVQRVQASRVEIDGAVSGRNRAGSHGFAWYYRGRYERALRFSGR